MNYWNCSKKRKQKNEKKEKKSWALKRAMKRKKMRAIKMSSMKEN